MQVKEEPIQGTALTYLKNVYPSLEKVMNLGNSMIPGVLCLVNEALLYLCSRRNLSLHVGSRFVKGDRV